MKNSQKAPCLEWCGDIKCKNGCIHKSTPFKRVIWLILFLVFASLASAQTPITFNTGHAPDILLMKMAVTEVTTIHDGNKIVASISKDSVLTVIDSVGTGKAILKIVKLQSEQTKLWLDKYWAAIKVLDYIQQHGKMEASKWEEFNKLIFKANYR